MILCLTLLLQPILPLNLNILHEQPNHCTAGLHWARDHELNYSSGFPLLLGASAQLARFPAYTLLERSGSWRTPGTGDHWLLFDLGGEPAPVSFVQLRLPGDSSNPHHVHLRAGNAIQGFLDVLGMRIAPRAKLFTSDKLHSLLTLTFLLRSNRSRCCRPSSARSALR